MSDSLQVYSEKPSRTVRKVLPNIAKNKTTSWQVKEPPLFTVFGFYLFFSSVSSLIYIGLHCRAPPLLRIAMEHAYPHHCCMSSCFLKPPILSKIFGSRKYLVYPSPNPDPVTAHRPSPPPALLDQTNQIVNSSGI